MEHVVLVDDHNQVLGTAPKATVHGTSTPLHRAFSLFLFNEKGEVLLQQRSLSKKTWPGIWSNSCCGHPALGEPTEDAVRRRALDELGCAAIENLAEALPDFRYCCVLNGVMENELCPVWTGNVIAESIVPNPEEVAAIQWKNWEDFVSEIQSHPGTYSEWCELEVAALESAD